MYGTLSYVLSGRNIYYYLVKSGDWTGRFVVPRRTHDVKIGYIPIHMLILSVKASQVLVVPKNVGFSIPRYDPEPEP